MENLEPKVPENLHPLGREILDLLRSRPEASGIILGGGVALQHYCPSRRTKDIDAWWQDAPIRATQAAIEQTMNEVARHHGYTLNIRSWGETDSYELQQAAKTIFSFQIAIRTIELEPPKTSPWAPLKIETLRDNLASKMNAVVARGAPRDFLDIFEVCHRGIATSQECWALWQEKNPGKSVRSARVNISRHLQQLAARRPLEAMRNEDQRQRARSVRTWLRNSFCREIDPLPGD